MNPRLALASLLLAAFIGTAPGTAAAQVPTGGGWSAWYGCWEPIAPDLTLVREGVEAALCIVPESSDRTVEILTLEEGAIVGRETMSEVGLESSVSRDGCNGTERSRWSADGRRLYQWSELTCPGGIERRTSGIFGINPAGEWIVSEAVSVGDHTDVRVLTYRPVPALERTNREVAAALEGRSLAIDAARTLAAAPADLADVREASDEVDLAAVEGWLIAQDHGFEFDGATLVRLADTGMPETLIDLIVALSYPRVFAIDRSDRAGERRDDGEDLRDWGPRRRPPPWYFPGSRGGYYPGWYGGGWYGRPVIIVRDPDDFDAPDRGGRAVNGRGYTRRPSSGDTGGSSGPRPSSGPSGDSSGGSSSTGSVGSGSGSRGTDTGRTAKPR